MVMAVAAVMLGEPQIISQEKAAFQRVAILTMLGIPETAIPPVPE